MIIQRGDPSEKGDYVVFFGDKGRALVHWTGAQFIYCILETTFPFKAKGWIGPLPTFGEPVLEFDL